MFESLTQTHGATAARVDFWEANPGQLAGLTTGYKVLDDLTGGLEPSDLVILAGRPGMGKTALALNVAAKVANNVCRDAGGCIAIVSTEMPASAVHRRLAAMFAKINEHQLRRGTGTAEQFALFRKALRQTAALPILVSDRPGAITESGDLYDPKTIGGGLRCLVRDGRGPRLLIVDHIGRLGDDPGTMANYRIGGIARRLKNLAMETNVPVLLLSQLSRAVEARDDKRPQLSDLRDSGEVEQEADQVWLIYRPDYYTKPDMAGYDGRNKNKCIVDVAKARSGPTGEVVLGYDPNTTCFF